MSFSAGVYTLPSAALNTGDTVSATENNTLRNDMASSFNLTWLRNGTAAATANIPMGGFELTNAAAIGSNSSLLLKSNNGTNAVTIDASQNVGVGVTPSAWGVYKSIDILSGGSVFGAASKYVGLSANAYNNGSGWRYKNTDTAGAYQITGNTHEWDIAASGTAGNTITFTQAMTLDSGGNLLVGQTTAQSAPASGFCFNAPTTASYGAIGHANGSASGTGYFYFSYNAGFIGSITQNGTTGVLYNLTSDYRLKNNQEALTGAKDFIMALKPKKWQWWDGSGEGVGFVAHEFMEVAKYSGHGEKDAVETIEIKDEDGNVTGTEERPVYQSIQPSSSEVMANLVSLIQEQQSLIQSLTDRLTALEGAAK